MKTVVGQLALNPALLLTYLSEMFNSRRFEYDVRDMAEFHDLQIRLHVEHRVSVPHDFEESVHAHLLNCDTGSSFVVGNWYFGACI